MKKTLTHVIVDVLKHAKRRASSTRNDGEALWLHTYVVEPLQDVLEVAAPGHNRFVWDATDVETRVSKRSKK